MEPRYDVGGRVVSARCDTVNYGTLPFFRRRLCFLAQDMFHSTSQLIVMALQSSAARHVLATVSCRERVMACVARLSAAQERRDGLPQSISFGQVRMVTVG